MTTEPISIAFNLYLALTGILIGACLIGWAAESIHTAVNRRQKPQERRRHG